MSDFAGLNVALSALYAQRRGLEITGHNVANANTEGYSRQRVDLESVGGARTGSFWSRTAETGGGVGFPVRRKRAAVLRPKALLVVGHRLGP